MTTTTNNEAPNPLARMAADRRNTLKLLARSANLSHRWASASAGAAVAHVVAAGNALAQARELCEEGGWTRWLRKNFDGSVRTAQRYLRVARHLPTARINATSVSLESQAAAMRAIRAVVFTAAPAVDAGAAQAASAAAGADDEVARRAVAIVAARRLRKLASALAPAGSGGYAAEVASQINALAADLLLDNDAAANTCGQVYFVEAVGADRVKIGVSNDVPARFTQLVASFPGPLELLGTVPGGRAREAWLHQRLADFRIGGEWFHLTPRVRAVIQTLIADNPE